jgi:hypothetical protein
VFVGSATTGNLWSPASPNCAAGPAGTPVCPRNNVGWSFASDIAAAASAGKKPTGIAGVLNADAAASISGSGTLEGWCGQSLGSGGGSVGASGKSYSFSISWVSGGSVLILIGDVSGEGRSGPLVAVVDAVPTTGSCLDGTATGFTVVGAGAFATV